MKKIIIICAVLVVFISLGLFFYFSKSTPVVELPVVEPTKEVRLPKPPINETKPKLTEFVATVLTYHHIGETDVSSSYYVSPENFDKQLGLLNDKGYHFISYEHLYNAMANGGTLPKKPVVVSFDDGVTDQYTNALPILKKYQVPAIFFISVKNVDTEVGLTWGQIKDLANQGMTIGSHSMSHSNLKDMSKEDIEYELKESKKIIEEKIGAEVKFFSYPKGGYDQNVIEAAKEAGYISAVNTRDTNTQKIVEPDDLFEVPRLHIKNTLSGIFSD